MLPARLAYLDGLLAFALFMVGMLAAHFYVVAPLSGFVVYVLGFFLGLIGIVIGLVAIFTTRKPETRAGRTRALVGTGLCLIVTVPIILTIVRSSKYPPINDITTDTENPPEFVFAQKLQHPPDRDMKYDKAKYAATQQAGYGIIAPLKEKLEPAAAFARVTEVAQGVPTWKITYSDPAKNTLEAVATSNLFHFADDVVIEIRPTPDGESLIEMRSKSRDGTGDLGVNARRIHRFFDRVALARGTVDPQTMP
ncbi:MAG TPA: DUF1499 domain-containing protein [Candidatus Acidoferrales bacterium]|nr:DUF1499 domain-containing protein [Candidatus Acidoferrales bacterium]